MMGLRGARRPAWIGVLWTALVVAVGCAPEGPGADRGTAREPTRADHLRAIEALHERDERAAVAGDTAALAKLWTEDIVALPPGEAPVRGADAMREDLRARLSDGSGWETLEYELDFEEVVIRDGYAFEWGTYRGLVRDRASGDTIEGGGNLMRILKRMPDGEWKVHRTIWND